MIIIIPENKILVSARFDAICSFIFRLSNVDMAKKYGIKIMKKGNIKYGANGLTFF